MPESGQIAELRVDADPGAWASCGFAVEGSDLQVGPTLIRFEPGCRGDAGAICSWTLAGVREGDFDGLPTSFTESAPAPEPPVHPSTVTGIDHVVVFSSSLERTIEEFEAAGVRCRRVREIPVAPDRTRQAFFRLGPSIVEVLQVPEENAGPDGRSRFWGLAFVVADIDAAAELLGERLGRVKDAVQPGRRIGTIRKEAGLGVSVALLTPDPKHAAIG